MELVYLNLKLYGRTSFWKAVINVMCECRLHNSIVDVDIMYTFIVLVGFPLFWSRALYLCKL
jgi:hypothetical protein